MRILLVIHGYPPYYMAGSEVYTYNLAQELSKKGYEVFIFTRIENPYEQDYTVTDSIESNISIHRINKAKRDYTFQDKYLDPNIDQLFREYLKKIKPDIVHIGHLSQLSTQLPIIAKREFKLPVVFTIHDFWMFCYRGQLITPDLKICEGPYTERCTKCAKINYKEYVKTENISEYKKHMKTVLECIDLFLSPSHTLESFYKEMGIPNEKIKYSLYGFDINRIKPVPSREKTRPLTFGFMGRIIPVKGISLLIKAFHNTHGESKLKIYGEAGSHKDWLSKYFINDTRIEFCGAYHNNDIQEVLNSMDIMVCPSIWLENAPLVIQEAQLAHLPVITSDVGGMAELIENGKNGFTFPLGNEEKLKSLLQNLIDNPQIVYSLNVSGDFVRSISDDTEYCISLYKELIKKRTNKTQPLTHNPAPWRMTFVTNPGICNLKCIMCDTHSSYAKDKLANKKILPVLDFSVVEKVIREMAPKGLKEIIPSTMGEPLLYDHFENLIHLAEELDLKINLTTNGTFPKGSKSDVSFWAKQLLPVLSDIKISINGFSKNTNESIMVNTIQEKHLSNIEKFIQLRNDYYKETNYYPTITLQYTFMKSNIEELPELLKWAISKGIDRIKGHHLWITWPQIKSESLKNVKDAKRWNEIIVDLQKISDELLLPNGKKIILANFLPLNLNTPEETNSEWLCPFLGKEAWIEADSSFQVCCCPSDIRKDFGDFGSVKNNSFSDLWESIVYSDFIKNWGTHPNCKKCNMRQPIQKE